ncbi:uncharacterized protein BO72DRAFT_521118 [Aspergillus fijiensis CBS 313.89]|uniref:Uncharacterized protein n=1 Tax=Aspergillus fijiensis CBS 313.89 TaxID=1448319 RepID=A0A8G1VTN9_9EURO|nr:uncharacterized protein BO72DRAFT_521118 [Aspergillus fijiensis CBS 313.89]RAK72287.1 hypothetical protein BO72DRAFT_521118 [Aspergillus fijiensis CBS 313.89]
MTVSQIRPVRLSPETTRLLEIDAQYSAGGVFPLPVLIKSGKGSDVDGKEIIDFHLHAERNQPRPVPTAASEGFTLTNIATKVGDWVEFTRDMCQRFGYGTMVGMVYSQEERRASVCVLL